MKQEEIFGEARWIAPEKDVTAPYLRASFTAGEFQKARISICGLGFFELFINGRRVGRDLFVPVVSDFEKRTFTVKGAAFDEEFGHRIYCPEYDVTDWIHAGKNEIAVALAPGWYGQEIWAYDEKNTAFGTVKLIYRLKLETQDGSVAEVLSGDDARFWPGPICKYDLFLGETHDYRCELDGWQTMDTGAWKKVIAADAPLSNYQVMDCPADRVIRQIVPRVVRRRDAYTVYDAGVNLSGWVVVRTNAPAGEKIVIRHSEELMNDGRLDEEKCYGQESVFIADGKTREMHTRFTWNGFRYFSVTNNAQCAFVSVVHMDVPVTGRFTCANETLNWLNRTYIDTQLFNLHSGIPSDCPHIERRGYTGDGQLTCETAMLTLSAQAFYRKWLRDISDCQDRVTGHVQYTAPYTRCGGGPGGWGSAIVEVPWQYYRAYGDDQPMRDMYAQMLRYFDYLEAHSEDGLVTSDRPGEWCLGDWCTPEKIQIPEPYVNNYFYIRAMKTVLRMQPLLGHSADAALLQKRIAERLDALKRHYFDAETGDFAGNIQGANAFAVDIGAGDARTYANMAAHYRASGMYDTGIFGTEIVTRVLFEHGDADTAYALLAGEKEFSYHEMMARGATTLWEYWTGERSHSHPMFGAAVKTLYQEILGISQTADSAGYRAIVIAPKRIAALPYAEGGIETPAGRISVKYVRGDDGYFFTVSVPAAAVFRFGNVEKRLPAGESCFLLA